MTGWRNHVWRIAASALALMVLATGCDYSQGWEHRGDGLIVSANGCAGPVTTMALPLTDSCLDELPGQPQPIPVRLVTPTTAIRVRCGSLPIFDYPCVPTATSTTMAAINVIVIGQTGGSCHPAYDPCVRNLPGDALNCPQVGKQVRLRQRGVDPYRLDADNDGLGCDDIPSSETPTPPATTTVAIAPATTVARQACHPSYAGACLRSGVGDYDCLGGGGDGPNFVAGPIGVAEPDVFGLDRNNDGIGCQ